MTELVPDQESLKVGLRRALRSIPGIVGDRCEVWVEEPGEHRGVESPVFLRAAVHSATRCVVLMTAPAAVGSAIVKNTMGLTVSDDDPLVLDALAELLNWTLGVSLAARPGIVFGIPERTDAALTCPLMIRGRTDVGELAVGVAIA